MRKFIGKGGFKIVSALAIVCSFMMLALACASAPDAKDTSTITMVEVNGLVKNQEASFLINNGLSGDQFMEVIKLCIRTGELSDVALVEENAKLSYGAMAATMKVMKIPVIVKFSCSISKNGSVKLRVLDVREQNPEVDAFNVRVKTDEYDAKCDAIKNLIMKKIKEIGETVVSRSADFA